MGPMAAKLIFSLFSLSNSSFHSMKTDQRPSRQRREGLMIESPNGKQKQNDKSKNVKIYSFIDALLFVC